MLKITDFSCNKLLLTKTEKTIADLRNSQGILLKDQQKRGLILIAAEYYNINHSNFFKKCKIDKLSLLLTLHRANYLFSTNQFHYLIIITIKSDDLDIINRLIMRESQLTSHPISEIKSADNLHIGSLELCNLAKLLPAAIIYEFLPQDAEKIDEWVHNNYITSISLEDIHFYKANHSASLQMICNVPLTLQDAGHAKIYAFRSFSGGKEHYALVVGDITQISEPYICIHSSCYTGDLLGSLTCDCGDQLKSAIRLMASDKENAGIIIYLMQEGRGIGFINKLRTYNLQKSGLDTVEANTALGFEIDQRSFKYAADILKLMNIDTVKLLSNNPEKASELQTEGIKITEIVPLKTDSNLHNEFYLKTKAEKLNHAL